MDDARCAPLPAGPIVGVKSCPQAGIADATANIAKTWKPRRCTFMISPFHSLPRSSDVHDAGADRAEHIAGARVRGLSTYFAAGPRPKQLQPWSQQNDMEALIRICYRLFAFPTP